MPAGLSPFLSLPFKTQKPDNDQSEAVRYLKVSLLRVSGGVKRQFDFGQILTFMMPKLDYGS